MSDKLNRWLGRTAYQIMPDRFCRVDEPMEAFEDRTLKAWNDRMPNWRPGLDGEYKNDYFYGGNLKGIISKLEYIRELGFTMIYITPIGSSHSYHHYDPQNHMEIDQWLGTWDDFKDLCNRAHQLGILVVVDVVFNHTGIKSIYYEEPQYAHWYKRKSSGEISFWWGFKDLPECNTLDKSYQEEMKKVLEKYLENGADGVRFDLGEGLSKEFLLVMGEVKEQYPETIFIGEMWGFATDKSQEDGKIFDGQLDSIMNYPISDGILRWVRWGFHAHFIYNYSRVYGEYPFEVQNLLLNNIGTHDTPTTMTMLGGEKMNDNVFDKQIWDIEAPWRTSSGFDTYRFREFEAQNDELKIYEYVKAKAFTKIAIAIMYFLPGIPCIYQGTEIAETGYKDPFNRKPYNWDNLDEEMIEFVAKMGKIREENKDILAKGNSRIIKIDESVLIIERFNEFGNRIVIAVNRTSTWQYYMIPGNNTNMKVVYGLEGCSNTWLSEFGIFIARQ